MTGARQWLMVTLAIDHMVTLVHRWDRIISKFLVHIHIIHIHIRVIQEFIIHIQFRSDFRLYGILRYSLGGVLV